MTAKPELRKRNTPIKLFLGSASRIKIAALQQAIWDGDLHAAVTCIGNADSGVKEQPVGEEEMLQGAINRVLSAYRLDARGDVYFSAENGITWDEGSWLDYAIVLAYIPTYNVLTWVCSKAVKFPTEVVDITCRKPGGFQSNTVGKTLQLMGLVQDHADPHLDLVGKSRSVILADSFKELFNYLPQGVFLP